ncbi:MAG TPA: hypothetical protein VIL63_05805, partial [Terriglobales bacterium]
LFYLNRLEVTISVIENLYFQTLTLAAKRHASGDTEVHKGKTALKLTSRFRREINTNINRVGQCLPERSRRERPTYWISQAALQGL